MTERLYYRDAFLRTFAARVVRSDESSDGRFRTVLDRTAFYPASGGQPFDLGHLGGIPVVEVSDEDSEEIAHITNGRLDAGREVEGEIDWARRFDHMQQHTGQHVLSAAIERAVGVATMSFHLGSSASTIDLARELTPAEIERAENEANEIVWENRPVTVRFVDADEAARLPLRKESARSGMLRLVEVENFDLSACGGTHVSRTGEIGIIGVTAWERFKSGTRLTFRCGKRALASHRELRDSMAEAGRVLSVGAAEVAGAATRMSGELRAQERRLTDLTREVSRYRAAEWRAEAETIGRFRGVLRADASLEGAALKAMAQAVVAGGNGLVVVLAGGGEPAPVVVARSSDVEFDAGAFLKTLIAALGGRGGGRPELAQGGVTSDLDRVIVTTRQLLTVG